MRIKIKSKRGQAMILTLVFMTVILGMAAVVVDVGAWYRAHRQMQNNADAAALAGATALPESTGQAASLALTYADRNGGGVTGSDITFSSKEVANDQIQVTARKAVPGVFAKLFGLDSVTVRAHATALAAPPAQPKWAAPFGGRRHAPDAPVRAAAVLQPGHGRSTWTRSGRARSTSSTSTAARAAPAHPTLGELGGDRPQRVHAARLVLLATPGSKFNSGPVKQRAGRPDRERPAVPRLPRGSAPRAPASSTR